MKTNEQATAKTKYSAQNSIFDINGGSRVYYLSEIEDERYQIFFGDGIFGASLEEGNFVDVDYVVSTGDTGNGVAQMTFAGNLS